MAKKIVKEIVIKVSDNGSLKVTTKEVDKLNKAVDRSSKANKTHSKSSQTLNRNMKGISRQSSNASKNFSKQAQGMQGVLVPAYAEVAARVFALTAAFTALSNAANYSILIQGQDTYAQMTGKHMGQIAKSVQIASKHMLDFKEASTSVALASTSGLSSKQIVNMTKAAVDSSAALGRSVSDTMDRLTRGIVKAEPEILDEIGVIIRLDRVYKDYAISVSKSTAELTEGEKASARYTAIMGQLETKFGGIADRIDPNYFAALSSTVLDLINAISSKLVTGLGPLLKFLAESKGLLLIMMALISKSLIGKIFPAFGEFGKKMQNMPKQMDKSIRKVEKSIAKLNKVMKGPAAIKGRTDKILGKSERGAAYDKSSLKSTGATLRQARSSVVKGIVTQGKLIGKTSKALAIQEKAYEKLNKDIKTNNSLVNKSSSFLLKQQKRLLGLKKVTTNFGATAVRTWSLVGRAIDHRGIIGGVTMSVKVLGKAWKAAAISATIYGRAVARANVAVSGIVGAGRVAGKILGKLGALGMGIFVAFTMAKMLLGVFMDFDTAFDRATKAASTLNVELKKTLENLEKRPDDIRFDGIAGNFTQALKNADFAASLAEEIYNATSKAMKQIGADLSNNNWFDRLSDWTLGWFGKSFEDNLTKSLIHSMKMAKISAGDMPIALQSIVERAEEGGTEKKIASLKSQIKEKEELVFKTPWWQLTSDEELRNNKMLVKLRRELASIKQKDSSYDDIVTEALDVIPLNRKIEMMEQFAASQTLAADSARLHASNLKELGQAFNKVGTAQKTYAESLVPTTAYSKLADAQKATQTLMDTETISKSEVILGSIAGGDIKSPIIIKLQRELKEARKDKLELEASENKGTVQDRINAVAEALKEVQRIENAINTKTIAIYDSLSTSEGPAGMYSKMRAETVTGGIDYIALHKAELDVATERMGLEMELTKLSKKGTSTYEKQAKIKRIILKNELDLIQANINTGKLEDEALAAAKMLLETKTELGKFAIENFERQAALKERTTRSNTETLTLQNELNSLNKIGNSTLEQQATIKEKLLNLEAAIMRDNIINGNLSGAALAMEKEQLRVKEQQAKVAGATAYSSLMNQAAISGKPASLADKYAALAKDKTTELGIDLPPQLGGTNKLEKALTRLKRAEIDERNTLLNKIKNTSEAELAKIDIESKHWKKGKKIVAYRIALAKIERTTADYVLKQAEKLALYKKTEGELLHTIKMAQLKEETEWLTNAMNTIANSFGSSISSAVSDIFMNKGFDMDKFRTSLAQGFANAAGKIVGDMAQKAAFGNQGLLANMFRKMKMGEDLIKTMFPKSDLQIQQDQLTELQTENTKLDTSNNFLKSIEENTRKVLPADIIRANETSSASTARKNLEVSKKGVSTAGQGLPWKYTHPYDANEFASTTTKGLIGKTTKSNPIEITGETTFLWKNAPRFPEKSNVGDNIATSVTTGTAMSFSRAAVQKQLLDPVVSTIGKTINHSIENTPMNISGNLLDPIISTLFGEEGALSSIIKPVSGKMGFGGFNAGFSGGSTSSSIIGSIISGIFGFKNGGTISGGFRAFANGGIANKPTLGMIGEGRHNEAVVPLPDGKSIPIKGEVGNTNNVTVNVSVDAAGQAKATESTGDGAKELGYMLSQAVQQELVQQQRPGGLLSAF